MALIDSRLRVMTWNIWWQFGPWEERLPAIGETIEKVDPDIVGLQEVWATDDRNQAAELGERLGYEHVYASRVEWDGVEVGNAVLSRWPIESYETMPLPAPEHVEEFRLVLPADIAGPGGAIHLFPPPLTWRFDPSEVRQDQIHPIPRFIARAPPRESPPILCGDFNAPPDSDEIRM